MSETCQQCGGCCGPVICHLDERTKVEEYALAHGIVPNPMRRPLDCPWLDETMKCMVYAVRPFICRLWGRSELTPCAYGHTTHEITKKEAARITSAYVESEEGVPLREEPFMAIAQMAAVEKRFTKTL